MSLTRRALLRTGALAFAGPVLARGALRPSPASAQERVWHHGLSLFGDVKYPAGFKHFDYVNPNAPKGGVVRLSATGAFDNFNPVVSGVKGTPASGLRLLFDGLITPSYDEVSTEYGLLAEKIAYAPDFSSAVYRLRVEAKWHDGAPVTPEDVIFSLDAFRANSPQYSAYYRHVAKAEKTGEREVTFTFDAPGNRELPLIIGELMVLPKHWWEGTDSAGRKRDVSATTLEPPLGSGAYRIKEFAAGRNITYERVKGHWGESLNVNIGQNNFDEVRYEYFRDTLVALEAFKADQIDWRVEPSAKSWATAYDFPAAREKRVVLEEFPIRNSGRMQAFVFNLRRDKFKDVRVREAFNLAFDFEEMNKQLFYGQYTRINSYFDGTELASTGLPHGEELKILDPVRAEIPPDIFTAPYKNPIGGSSEAVRNNLRQALRLLKEAGYEVRNTKLVNAKTGEPYTVEILCSDPNVERLALFYQPSLERLGMTVSVRTVDNTQYVNRTRDWDFDIAMDLWVESLSPGNEQREFWGSAAADQPGSRNLAGIKNPAVDAVIDRIIYAKDRPELVAATKALDRVLLQNFYMIPLFTYGKVRTVRWDRFGKPNPMPKYGTYAFPLVWWWDSERAAKVTARG